MIVKKHITPDKRLILAVCDKDLLGKCLEENNLQLDLSGSFYDGTEKNAEETKKDMKKAYIINLVGKESVQLGIDMGLIENIKQVSKIPYASAIILKE